jgi:hypothetical protein
MRWRAGAADRGNDRGHRSTVRFCGRHRSVNASFGSAITTSANLSLLDLTSQFLGSLKLAINQNPQSRFIDEFRAARIHAQAIMLGRSPVPAI